MDAAANKGVKFIIHADDKTAATFARVVQNADKFGKSLEKGFAASMKRALAPTNLLSTLNLLKMAGSAVSGVFSSIAESVEEGARAQLAVKSFASVVGLSERHATGLARQLQEAAMNTMDLQAAMQMANRSMLAGLSFDQMKQITAFASRKSSTMGISTTSAVERMVMGLSRGSPQILDDFALLVDGLEGVERAYNTIHGKDAFKALGPAAQKAEITAAAIREMADQTKRLGIDGNENLVRFDALRTIWSDIVTDIQRAVATSPRLAGIAKDITAQFAKARTFISDNFESIAGIMNESIGTTVGVFGGMSGGVLGQLFKGFDTGEIAKSITAVLAKIPLVFAGMGIKVEQIFLGLSGSITTAMGKVVEAMAIPIASIAKLAGVKDGALNDVFFAIRDAGQDMRQFGSNALGAAENLETKFIGIVDAMDKIDEHVSQLGANKGMAELARQAAAAAINIRSAFAGAAASARGAINPIADMLGKISKKTQEAAKEIGDRLKKAFEAAGDKAKEAADRMKEAEDRIKELQRAQRGEVISNAERRFDIMMSRTRNPMMQNRLRLEFANWLGQQAGRVGGDEAIELQRRRMDMLTELAKDPRIMRDRKARNMVDREIVGGEKLLLGHRDAAVDQGWGDWAAAWKDKRHAQAEQARIGHQMQAQAFNEGVVAPLKMAMTNAVRAVGDFGSALKVATQNVNAVGAQANPGGGVLGQFFAGVRQAALAAEAGGA